MNFPRFFLFSSILIGKTKKSIYPIFKDLYPKRHMVNVRDVIARIPSNTLPDTKKWDYILSVDFEEIRGPYARGATLKERKVYERQLKQVHNLLSGHYPTDDLDSLEMIRGFLKEEQTKNLKENSDYTYRVLGGYLKYGPYWYLIYASTSSTIITDWNGKENTIFQHYQVLKWDEWLQKKVRNKYIDNGDIEILRKGWELVIGAAKTDIRYDDKRCKPYVIFTGFDPNDNQDRRHLVDTEACYIKLPNGKVLKYVDAYGKKLVPMVKELLPGKFETIYDWKRVLKHAIMDELTGQSYDDAYDEKLTWDLIPAYRSNMKILNDLCGGTNDESEIELVPLTHRIHLKA